MAGLSSAGGGGISGAVRAGRAFVELYAEDNKVYRAIDRLQSRFRGLGTFLVKVGAVTGGVGASVTAAFKPALDALGENAKLADAADAFGLTAEEASRLFGIMAAGGSDIRDATEGLVTFNQRVSDGLAGTGEEAKQLFEGLGVAAQDFANLNSAERFFKLIDALKAVPDPAKRVQLLLKAVGEDTGKNLVPLLAMTADQVRELGDAFESSAEDLKAARDATRAQKVAMAQLNAVWGQVATAIAPSVKEFAEAVTKNVKPVIEFVKENRRAIAIALSVATALTVAGAAFVGLGTAAGGIAAAVGGVLVVLKGLVVAVSAILSPVGLITAAIAGLGYLFVRNFDAIKAAFTEFASHFGALGRLWVAEWNLQENAVRGFAAVFRDSVGIVQEAWGGIVAAVGKGDLSLAGEIALTALELIWAKTFAQMARTWNEFQGIFVDGWHHITDGLGEPLRAMWKDVQEVLDNIWGAVLIGWEKVKEAFASAKETLQGFVEFLTPIVAPIVAPFLLIADLIRQAWEGVTGNIMTDIISLGTFVEKAFEQVAHAIDNAFSVVMDRVIGAVASAAEALDAITPGDKFQAIAEDLRRLQTQFGADARKLADEESKKRLENLDKVRDKIIADLKVEREAGKKAREEARAEDAKAADERVAELQRQLDALNARARMPGLGRDFGGGADFGPALARVAEITGSRGTFSSEQARQFGGSSIQKKQLDKLESIDEGIGAVVKGVEGIAKGLRFQ